MANTIENDDVKIGGLYTVMRWRNGTDRSYVGSVLKVVAIDLPFVVFEEIANRWGHDSNSELRRSLDVREIEFGTVSEGYMKALTEKLKPVKALDCGTDDDDLSE